MDSKNESTRPLLMLESGRKRKPIRGLLSATQAATSIGVDEQELARMRTAGEGPAAFVMTPRIVRYSPTAVAAWKVANGR